jgi:exopolysaccharide biosynthesis polyprenyl glycosylphosphotransferase
VTAAAKSSNGVGFGLLTAGKSTLEQSALLDLVRLRSSNYLRTGEILSKEHFLSQLRREKLRTDRSGAPLSIAMFTCEAGERSVMELVELLRSRKRETDVLGHLEDNIVGVLLPDTNEHGAARLTEKILSQAGDLPLSATTRTYPDHLFEALISDNQAPGDLFPFVQHETRGPSRYGSIAKRGLDLFGASLAIVLALPVMAAIACAVALSSPGPIIFRQIRLGKGGAPFVFYKFRSMRCDADDRIHREYVANLIQGNLAQINQGDAEKPLYKLKRDPRVTAVGRIIRKTSLDELPQLFNVLKGEMSLVGPRPPVPYEVEKYQSWHLRRILEVKPGITGLWQVEGRSRASFDEMVRLDLRYVRESSFAFDLRILLKTVRVVLVGDGAS